MDEDKASAVSALMDGELPRARAERALDALLDDPALREQWRVSHAASDALNGRYVAGGDALAERVRRAIDSEPVAHPAVHARRWSVQPWLGVAMAASLAVAALLVVRGLDTHAPGSQAVPQVVTAPSEPSPATVAGGGVVPVATTSVDEDSAALTRLTWNDPRPDVAKRLNGYLLNHNQYQATGVQGMLPYARVVGYEPYD